MSAYKTNHPLILASSSSIREQMMRQAGLAFTVMRPKFDEESAKDDIANKSMPQQAQFLAQKKAECVSEIHPSWLVVGADQICELDGEMLQKPGDEENAFNQLKKMQGKTHSLHSAVCLVQDGKVLWSDVLTANMTMRSLSDEEIYRYIQLDKPLSSCGCYMFEQHGKHLFKDIQGSDDVIQGLPMVALLNALYELDLIVKANAA